MESNNNRIMNREKKNKRKEKLEKKKAIHEVIKVASSTDNDNLASFPPFRHYDRNGLYVYLESGCGDKLSSTVKQYIQNLLKVNMEGPFGSEWPTEEKVKRREMVAPEARYIFVRETLNAGANEMSTMLDKEKTNCVEDRAPMVGFVHYRFTLEEEIPVLYVYELQLESRVQGKGLGKFLMQLIELIARKNCMGAVVLTVQKANLSAMNFYINMLYRASHHQKLIHCLELRRVMKFFAKHLIMKPKLHWRKANKLENNDKLSRFNFLQKRLHPCHLTSLVTTSEISTTSTLLEALHRRCLLKALLKGKDCPVIV